jgi:hypothetical protein
MSSDRSPLTPHRRQHWSVEPAAEPAAQPEAPWGEVLSPEETRVEAKRLLWRDSAIILIGIVVALLVAQFLPRLAPGFVADETASASGGGAGRTLAPGESTAPDRTFGPVVDPSLRIDATEPPTPPITLPPTGSFDPVETDVPTPRPTRPPDATLRPPPPTPTPEPTPDVTPEITPIPPPTVSISCSTVGLTVTCEATTSHIVNGSQRWTMGGDGVLVLGGDGSNSVVWTYLEAAPHTVRLTVDGDDGSQASDSAEVST